jgi:hypothetical protein
MNSIVVSKDNLIYDLMDPKTLLKKNKDGDYFSLNEI